MKASIDIGSNTILLLVAEPSVSGLQVIFEDQRAPRLARGVDSSGRLHPESVERAIQALAEYHEFLESSFPEVEEVIVTATSAVRDAANREAFLRQVRQRTGLETRLLSGEEEAEYTFAGAMSLLPDIKGDVAVLDIGGGSTELAVGSGEELSDRHSFDMGCVRFTERYLLDDPPGTGQITSCREAVEEMLKQRPFRLPEEVPLVGVAGTLTSLAWMDAGLTGYDREVLDGYRLSLTRIRDWSEKLSAMSSDNILKAYPEVMKGRADVFLAGVLILQGVMDYYEISHCDVSTGGIRHGVLLDSRQ